MVDLERRVCCMCGDVGFFDKLFHCTKCLNRYQHSYCSNYYKEQADPIKICDWCQCETKNQNGGVKLGGSSKRSYRSDYSSSAHNQIKQETTNQINTTTTTTSSSSISPTADKGKTSVPSPRPATRRYKLLKDVMC